MPPSKSLPFAHRSQHMINVLWAERRNLVTKSGPYKTVAPRSCAGSNAARRYEKR